MSIPSEPRGVDRTKEAPRRGGERHEQSGAAAQHVQGTSSLTREGVSDGVDQAAGASSELMVNTSCQQEHQ